MMDDTQLLTAIRSAVREETQELKDRMGALEQEVTSMNKRLGSVESYLGNVESRLGNVESRLGSVESRLGALEQEVTSMNKRLGSVESRLGALEEKVETNIGSIMTFENKIIHQFNLLNENLPNAIARHERLLELEKTSEDHEDRIYTLELAAQKG